MMKPTTLELLQWMTATATILRVLEATDQTMTYGDLAKAIGMTPDGWKGQFHQRMMGNLLAALSASEVEFNIKPPLNYARLINRSMGKPGNGYYRRNKIVRREGASASD